MNNQEFVSSREELDAACEDVLEAKGKDYAGEDGDRLANFKLIAELLANFHVDTSTPLGTWAVYKLKHVFAILAWIGQGTESEPIMGRFVDDRNYTDLGWGLVKDRIADMQLAKPKAARGPWYCGPSYCPGHVQPTYKCLPVVEEDELEDICCDAHNPVPGCCA